MWRRTYLLLAIIRLWFALSSSYLHPDENFQGPEVIAGEIFSYPVRRTWEFTNENPIRSVFPLWPVYGLPMLLLRWIWVGNGKEGEIAPIAVFWTLRVLMFLTSFVLEDWAVHELIPSPRHRRIAVLLVASSYVTWTYQTHTFSNSIETLVVAWSLVLIQRIVDAKHQSSILSSTVLGIVAVFGLFNRITFPAFLLIPGLRLIPHFLNKPLSLVALVSAALTTTLIAIALDTAFYTPQSVTWADLIWRPVITPLNNFKYNSATENLAQHGLHPWYQHLLANLPLLLGPAAVLLFTRPHLSIRLYSAISGLFVLSCFQHQEARFLLPTVPLILSSVRTSATEAADETAAVRRRRGILSAVATDFSIDMGFVIAGIVALIVLAAYHYNLSDGIWRVCFGIGIILPVILLFFRLRLINSTQYQKHAMKKRIPYMLVLKRYWKPILGTSLSWFMYDFVTYPFGIFGSTIISTLNPNDSLTQTIGYGTVLNCFYLPGTIIGGLLMDKIGRKQTMTLGFVLWAILGYIIGGAFEKILPIFPLFVVLYGIFNTLGEMGPGVATFLCGAESFPTPIRGHFLGLAAAVGKAGAAIGTQVFIPIQDNLGGGNAGVRGVFLIGASFALVGGAISWFLIPDRSRDLENEDALFREYLIMHGYDGDFGEQKQVS